MKKIIGKNFLHTHPGLEEKMNARTDLLPGHVIVDVKDWQEVVDLLLNTGAGLIVNERIRQVEDEGWTVEHDVEHHTSGQLAVAGACYALAEDARVAYKDDLIPSFWPWDQEWWKPTPDDPIRELAKAGALIAAEIDRLKQLEKTSPKNKI